MVIKLDREESGEMREEREDEGKARSYKKEESERGNKRERETSKCVVCVYVYFASPPPFIQK
jgi:hypothetical protein